MLAYQWQIVEGCGIGIAKTSQHDRDHGQQPVYIHRDWVVTMLKTNNQVVGTKDLIIMGNMH